MHRPLLLLLALPIWAMAGDGLPTSPYIYVEGRAEVERVANMATLRFDISALDATQAGANRNVQAQAGKVFALLTGSQIEDVDVIAGDLDSEAEYERDENGDVSKHGKFLGYRVSRPFVVKCRDLRKLPLLVDNILALEVYKFTEITPGLTEEKELKEEAWDQAILNARERAEKTLKSTGAAIDSLFAISPVAFPEIATEMFGDSHQWQSKNVAMMVKFDPSEYRLAPVSVSQRVHVIYLIRSGK